MQRQIASAEIKVRHPRSNIPVENYEFNEKGVSRVALQAKEGCRVRLKMRDGRIQNKYFWKKEGQTMQDACSEAVDFKAATREDAMSDHGMNEDAMNVAYF